MKRLWKFLVSFAIGLLVLSTGFSSWAFNVEAKANNTVQYSAVTGRIDNYLNNSSTSYASFTTLEDAVRNANTTVVGSNKVSMYLVEGSVMNVVNQSLTLNSGVSLILPYSGKLTDVENDSQINSLSNSIADSSSSSVNTNRKNLLNLVNTSINVSSGASIIVGGLTKTYGVCSSYAEINLDPNSHIEVSGSLTVLGLIKKSNTVNGNSSSYSDITDNSYDSNRYVTINSGATVTSFLGIHDMNSGGTLYTLNSNKICPLNKFNFPCIQTYFTLHSGCKFTGIIHLSVADNVVNTTAVVVSGNSSDKPLFTLTSGKISFEYCATNALYSSSSNKTKIIISGNCSLGSLSFSVSGVSITTSDRFLPLSEKLRIFIDNGAVFTIGYKVKLLCGGYLKIAKGGTVNLNSYLICYTSNATESSLPSQAAFGDSTFINNGALNLSSSGRIGALIQTESNDGTASVDLTNSSSTNLSVSSNETTDNVDITVISTGYFIDGDSTSLAQFPANSTVTSNNGNLAGWVGEFAASYTLSITVQNLYKYNLCGYRVYVADSSTGTNSTELTSEEINVSKTYSGISNRQYFKVASASSAASTTFTSLPVGTSYTFNSNQWFLMTGNIEVTIVPNEGVLIQINTQSVSGAGTTKYKITNASGGAELASFTSNGEVIMAVNTSFKIAFTGGTNSSLQTVTYDTITKTSLTTNVETSVANFDSAFTADDSYKFYVTLKASGGCFAAGVEVLMSDGTFKRIEDIQQDDLAMSWNFFTCSSESKGISLLIDHGEALYRVTTLEFSNGSSLSIIADHGVFDYDENQYVYITSENYQEYIGHSFVAYNNSGYDVVTLVSGYIHDEITHAYSLTTKDNSNSFANGILTTPPPGDFYNWIEMSGKLQYDVDKFNQDVERYGLYDYSVFEPYGISYETYVSFGGAYLKIPVDKGLFGFDYIIELFETYVEWMTNL